MLCCVSDRAFLHGSASLMICRLGEHLGLLVLFQSLRDEPIGLGVIAQSASSESGFLAT